MINNRISKKYKHLTEKEVKKPEETVKPDQHEEIEFLQSIGLHARVLRLDERT